MTLLVASAGFTALTAQSETARLGVIGTTEANARSAYDILVRPPKARLPLEEQRRLVQPGFLAGYPQGITLAQWQAIADVPGVEVAAPIAVVGWVVPAVQAPVDLTSVTDQLTEPTLLRRSTQWVYDGGASTVEAAPSWEYLTGNRVLLQTDPNPPYESWFVERFPDGRSVEHRNSGEPRDTVDQSWGGYQVACVEVTVACRFGFHAADPSFPYPFLVVAVDPSAEAALSGLDAAVTAGGYLDDAPLEERDISGDPGAVDRRLMVPVLVADEAHMQLSATYRVEDLGPDAAARVASGSLSLDSLRGVSGMPVAQGTMTADEVYAEFVGDMSTPEAAGAYYATSIRDVFRTGPGDFQAGAGGALRAVGGVGDPLAWDGRFDIAESRIPPGADDTAFHDLTGYVARWDATAPALVKVGTFDAGRLAGTTLSEVPLGTYAFSAPRGADAASRAALGEQAWLPSANIWGFVQAPPLMVTTLAALPAFSEPSAWSEVGRAGISLFGSTPVGPDPLSAVRVRVADVEGIDEVSRERVRVVAEAIATGTGLDVDITLGSSPSPQQIEVPAGVHGRPALTVTQNWVRKGVAVTLISAVDRKSLLLNAAILAVSAVVVINAALASVRARRRQTATLLITGWTRGAVFRAELGSLLLTSLAAGLAAMVLSLLLGVATGAPVAPAQAVVAVPAALVVAGLAGSVAAVSSARGPVIEAIRPTGARSRSGSRRNVHGVAGLGLRSALAAPGRSLLTAASVAVATAALGVLLSIQAQFHGQAIGSLLGDAINVQVRGPDLIAAAGILVLAGVGVAHGLTIEVRERAPELATLRATGWSERTLTTLLVAHAATIGILGATFGAAAAVTFQSTVLGQVTPTMLAAVGAAAAIGIAVAVTATWTPAHLLARIPTPSLLAED